jgi:hypothetical protein
METFDRIDHISHICPGYVTVPLDIGYSLGAPLQFPADRVLQLVERDFLGVYEEHRCAVSSEKDGNRDLLN